MKSKKKDAAAIDDRRGGLFGALAPPRSSDAAARAEMMETTEASDERESASVERPLLGWEIRTFNVLAQKLAPFDAAALTARLDAELERLGPAED